MTRAKMVQVAVDAHIRLDIRDRDLPWLLRKPNETDAEYKERQLKDWADEFREFLRDHRSQDANMLDVVMEYEKRCSECGNDWEPMAPDAEEPNTTCGHCGAYISGPNPPAEQESEAPHA